MDFFCYKYAPEGPVLLSDFFNEIWIGVESIPGPHLHAKSHRCGFQIVGSQATKSPKLIIFGINLPLRENPGVHRKT